MLQAMFSGVSGLQVHQTKLDVIGNNIANVNTLGFKAGTVTFEDQLSQTLRASASPTANAGGQNASQVGLGVTLGAIDTVQTQGNLQTTGKATDMAIQGNGFFLVSGGGSTVDYTRDGSFDLDSSGVMVNPANGLKLLGYAADANGVIDTSQPINSTSTIKVPVGSLPSAKETSTAQFQGNLNAAAAVQSTAVTITGNLDTGAVPTPMNTVVYDSQGNSHTLQVNFTNPTHNPAAGGGIPAGATQSWNVNFVLDGSAINTGQKIYAQGGKFAFAGTGSSLQTLNVLGGTTAPKFTVRVDFGGLQDTSTTTSAANGQTGVSAIQSTDLSLTGNLNLDSTGAPVSSATKVFDATGAIYTVTTTFSNPTVPVAGGSTPSGASQSWDMKVVVQPPSGPAVTSYDSSVAGNNESKAYYVPGSGYITTDAFGNSLGSNIQLVSGALPPASPNQGTQLAANFPLTIDLSVLKNSKTTALTDGQAGPSPTWNSSLTTFDAVGVKHAINVQFTRQLVGAGAPAAATSRWEWQATENGQPVASSTNSGNSALFFDNVGKLVNTNIQNVTVTPQSGIAPFSVALDFNSLTQLAGDSSVAVTNQNGYPVGTLSTFAISPAGLITGIFSNGQTRTLGQIATASFSNPGGLESVGQNIYQASSNSGSAQIGLPDLSGRGKISTGFVEMSNVDLATEFTNLIVTQRGFEANTKIITAVDQLLQNIIDLKR